MTVALAAALLSAITGHALCDLVFDCGCAWVFAGGEAHCNIHHPAPPHCPACSDPVVGAAFASAVFAGWAALFAVARAAVRRLRPAQV